MGVLDQALTLVSTEPWPAGRDGAFAELERGVRAALETYSNVHRGTGHNSLVSTYLFEQARSIVLEYLGLSQDRYVVIFCTPRRAQALTAQLAPGSYESVSSRSLGLPLGVWALAVASKALPRGAPFQTGGGTVRLVSPGWAIWADAPDRFEAGTPAIVNAIAFARALRMSARLGNDAFQGAGDGRMTAAEILYDDDLAEYSGRELLRALRPALLGRDVRVPTAEGARPYTNLDNAASTPTFSPIWDAVCQAWRQPQQVQREIVREVKSICAGFLGAPLADYEVLFTANTTEALNLAAERLGARLRHSERNEEPVVLNTLAEHNSNELPWRAVPGVALLRLPVDDEGFVNLDDLEKLLRAYNRDHRHGRRRIRLLAVTGASNVLGACNDLAALGRIAHRYGALFLVDAAQLVAHRKVEMGSWGIDALAFSAHKAYAPFGSGALVVRKGLLDLSPAEREEIRSSGEENVAGIAALGKALVLLKRIGMETIQEEEQALTAQALRGLARIPGVEVFGVQDPASPRFPDKAAIITLGLRNVPHNLVARELAERGGIGVRNGCFCAHLLVKRLLRVHPLRARAADLGLLLSPRFTSVVLPGLVRVSLGLENDEADVDTWLRVLGEIARQPRAWRDRRIAALRNGTPVLPQTEVQRQMDDFARAVAQRVYPYPRTGEGLPARPQCAMIGAEARGRPPASPRPSRRDSGAQKARAFPACCRGRSWA
jgi:selenocysteine lyase/cysteine desulfurase